MLRGIQEEIEKLLKQAGVDNPAAFSVPPKPEMGDVAFACFNIAKVAGKKPNEVATELASKISSVLKPDSTVEKVAAFGPYVNFFLNSSQVANFVIKSVIKNTDDFGSTEIGKGKKVMIEYPSNNTHKEFHIGHFRNVCIGNTLVKLYEKTGVKVYPVNYLNDFGSHVAKCLWGLKKFHGDEKAPANKQKWLGEIYAEASHYLKDHQECEVEVQEIQKQLEANDKKIWPLFIKTRKWSIDKFDELFEELGVKHMAVFYEKDIKAMGQARVDELLKKGIAKVGEGGAIIVDLSEYNLDIALLRKSNGVGLYLTSDIPLAEQKFSKYPVDESIVITGEEQKFYFKQLYKILELIGFKQKLTHLSYGLVNLPEGKMSSRSGNVILYESLRDQIFDLIVEETKQRHADWAKKKIIATSNILTQAALKFDMQKHEAVKNTVFDLKEATSFEGFSGPYILYTIARINSLEAKAKKEKISAGKEFGALVAPEEKALVLMMGEVETVIEKALENYNPSAIARYVFELAQAYNNFYNKHKVVGAESKELSSARLVLSQAVRQVLKNMLAILTIETVEEM
ncbi:MAG: arginine--tRNA ligase [Patescibacteria group bacterium]|jgi:arginyl-tRNA synthetase